MEKRNLQDIIFEGKNIKSDWCTLIVEGIASVRSECQRWSS